MDEHHVNALIARMHDGAIEQASTQTTAARLGQHRHAKLGALAVLGVLGKRQVGHGHQLQAPVIDAKNFIALKVQLGHVAANLVVVGGIAKAQVAVGGGQCQQVGGNAIAVRGTQRTDGNHHRNPGGVVGKGIAGVPVAHWAQQINASTPGCPEPVFGWDHGSNSKGFPLTRQAFFAAPQQIRGNNQFLNEISRFRV